MGIKIVEFINHTRSQDDPAKEEIEMHGQESESFGTRLLRNLSTLADNSPSEDFDFISAILTRT
jgi:hypothetical protein